MTVKKIKSDIYLIRLNRGEKIIQSLKNFCQKEKIKGGFFYGLGAVDEMEIAHYSVSAKKYSSKKFKQPLEMANLTGNISVFEKDLIIHIHAVFSDEKMNTIAGHLVEGKISGTAEIFLFKLPKLKKIYDQQTGLKLLDFKN